MADERTEKQKVKEITDKLEEGLKELLSAVEEYEDFVQALINVAPVPIGFEDIPGDSKGYFHTEEKRIAVQQYEVTNTTDKYLRSDNNWQMFVTNSFLYVKSYDSPYELYKIQINNPANVIKFKRTNVSSVNGLPKFVVNGRIYYENANDQLLIANTETNEIMPPEAQSLYNSSYQVNVTPVRNEPLIYFGDYGTWSTSGWHMLSNYLATINNLDTPVTKTADKTMKITYILQEQ